MTKPAKEQTEYLNNLQANYQKQKAHDDPINKEQHDKMLEVGTDGKDNRGQGQIKLPKGQKPPMPGEEIDPRDVYKSNPNATEAPNDLKSQVSYLKVFPKGVVPKKKEAPAESNKFRGTPRTIDGERPAAQGENPKEANADGQEPKPEGEEPPVDQEEAGQEEGAEEAANEAPAAPGEELPSAEDPPEEEEGANEPEPVEEEPKPEEANAEEQENPEQVGEGNNPVAPVEGGKPPGADAGGLVQQQGQQLQAGGGGLGQVAGLNANGNLGEDARQQANQQQQGQGLAGQGAPGQQGQPQQLVGAGGQAAVPVGQQSGGINVPGANPAQPAAPPQVPPLPQNPQKPQDFEAQNALDPASAEIKASIYQNIPDNLRLRFIPPLQGINTADATNLKNELDRAKRLCTDSNGKLDGGRYRYALEKILPLLPKPHNGYSEAEDVRPVEKIGYDTKEKENKAFKVPELKQEQKPKKPSAMDADISNMSIQRLIENSKALQTEIDEDESDKEGENNPSIDAPEDRVLGRSLLKRKYGARDISKYFRSIKEGKPIYAPNTPQEMKEYLRSMEEEYLDLKEKAASKTDQSWGNLPQELEAAKAKRPDLAREYIEQYNDEKRKELEEYKRKSKDTRKKNTDAATEAVEQYIKSNPLNYRIFGHPGDMSLRWKQITFDQLESEESKIKENKKAFLDELEEHKDNEALKRSERIRADDIERINKSDLAKYKAMYQEGMNELRIPYYNEYGDESLLSNQERQERMKIDSQKDEARLKELEGEIIKLPDSSEETEKKKKELEELNKKIEELKKLNDEEYNKAVKEYDQGKKIKYDYLDKNNFEHRHYLDLTIDEAEDRMRQDEREYQSILDNMRKSGNILISGSKKDDWQDRFNVVKEWNKKQLEEARSNRKKEMDALKIPYHDMDGEHKISISERKDKMGKDLHDYQSKAKQLEEEIKESNSLIRELTKKEENLKRYERKVEKVESFNKESYDRAGKIDDEYYEYPTFKDEKNFTGKKSEYLLFDEMKKRMKEDYDKRKKFIEKQKSVLESEQIDKLKENLAKNKEENEQALEIYKGVHQRKLERSNILYHFLRDNLKREAKNVKGLKRQKLIEEDRKKYEDAMESIRKSIDEDKKRMAMYKDAKSSYKEEKSRASNLAEYLYALFGHTDESEALAENRALQYEYRRHREDGKDGKASVKEILKARGVYPSRSKNLREIFNIEKVPHG